MQEGINHGSTGPAWNSWTAWLLAAAAVVLQLGWSRWLGPEASRWIASPLLPLILCLAALRPISWVPLAVAVFVLQPLMNLLVYDTEPSLGWLLLSAPLYALFWFGGRLATRAGGGLRPLLGTGLAAALLFYLASNTVAWLGEPRYARSLAGWSQAQTIGLPEYGVPSWYFLRSSILAVLAFVPLLLWVLPRLGLATAGMGREEQLAVAPGSGRL